MDVEHSQVVDSRRVHRRNGRSSRGGAYVLYWMERAQRARCNHALEHAARRAQQLDLPLVVCFGLTDDDPDASHRRYRFLLEGLRQTAGQLARRQIGFVFRCGHPVDVCLALAEDAAFLVMDAAYLRHRRAWRRQVAREAPCPVEEVEADVVVPAELASDKREHAARTIRPKLLCQRERFLVDLDTTPVPKPAPELDGDDGLLTPDDDVDEPLQGLAIDWHVPPVSLFFQGGTSRAKARLQRFLDANLEDYGDDRLDPARSRASGLSPYLHFGQISPIEIGCAVAGHGGAGAEDFLEELIVRRELAVNYCFHEPHYDRFGALPDWATKSLRAHGDDDREHVYTADELEQARTHDPYWNAAMNEMRYTGYLHNAMRMYWGKRILAWTNTPEHAFRVVLTLNNRYFLDGADPASFANVAWLFGLHDRAFGERPVFGKVRTMTRRGLERKYDMDAYCAAVDDRVERARAAGIRFDDEPAEAAGP